jgi:hypothetical protein
MLLHWTNETAKSFAGGPAFVHRYPGRRIPRPADVPSSPRIHSSRGQETAMRLPGTLTCLFIIVLAPCASLVAQEDPEPEFTADFPLKACRFVPYGGNPYFSLQPGRQATLNNRRCVRAGECEEFEEVRISVLHETRRIPLVIDGRTRAVTARVVEEFETEDGEVTEISRNYYATCEPDRDVYYFGEDVVDGEGNPLDDAWLAGVDDAEPGIIMPDRAFLLGARYFQEIAPDVAMDRAEHIELGLRVRVPEGTFRDCVRVRETTPLEPDSESFKTYCPGAGLVRDGDLELVDIDD